MAGFEGFGLFDPDLQDEGVEEEEEEDVFLSAAEMLDKVRRNLIRIQDNLNSQVRFGIIYSVPVYRILTYWLC